MPVFNSVGRGTYWRAFGFARELVNRDYSVTILAAACNRQLNIRTLNKSGVQVETMPSLWSATRGSGYDPFDTLSRMGWLCKYPGNFDLVHAFESRPSALLPSLYLQRRWTPYLSDWCDWFGRGGSVEERANPLLRSILRPAETLLEERSRPRANGVTVINTILKRKALVLGVPESYVLLLPNGANTEEMRPQDRTAVRARLGLPTEVPLIAYTGALFARDAALMVAAFKRIQAIRPNAKLLLIGYTKVNVGQMVGTPETVISTGEVPFSQLADYVAASTIGWLPLAATLANEGRFPMKLCDFMASGRAVVVSDVGDLGQVVRQHELGLTAPSDPEKLAQAVIRLLGETSTRRHYEQKARCAAETTFSWSRITDDLERFYHHFLSK